MKKFVLFTALFAVCVFALSACGNKKADEASTAGTTAEETTEATTDTTTTASETTAPAENN
ncbi:MAG: hypothetical protein LBL71_00330 [Endomicrobium sp.]|jgi:ABC-type glycerol-3-phosphate transport system substrate-binding protein|nr:hypothetical protein [Endomicrobium sp.]